MNKIINNYDLIKAQKVTYEKATVAIQRCLNNCELGTLPPGQVEIHEIKPGVAGTILLWGWALQSGLWRLMVG
jgi:hypothetical protein